MEPKIYTRVLLMSNIVRFTGFLILIIGTYGIWTSISLSQITMFAGFLFLSFIGLYLIIRKPLIESIRIEKNKIIIGEMLISNIKQMFVYPEKLPYRPSFGTGFGGFDSRVIRILYGDSSFDLNPYLYDKNYKLLCTDLEEAMGIVIGRKELLDRNLNHK